MVVDPVIFAAPAMFAVPLVTTLQPEIFPVAVTEPPVDRFPTVAVAVTLIKPPVEKFPPSTLPVIVLDPLSDKLAAEAVPVKVGDTNVLLLRVCVALIPASTSVVDGT
jgi:hypothetical protein